MTNGTRRGWGVSVTPWSLFTPGERPGTHCTGGWLGPRVGQDRCRKSRPPPGFDPRTAQPVASRYTDYAIRPSKLGAYRKLLSVHLYWHAGERELFYRLIQGGQRLTDNNDIRKQKLCSALNHHQKYRQLRSIPVLLHGYDTKSRI